MGFTDCRPNHRFRQPATEWPVWIKIKIPHDGIILLLLLCIYDVRQPVKPSGNTYYWNVRKKKITASGYNIIIIILQ